MIVYHGSDLIVKSPDIAHSYRPLDFGKGFYVTSNKEQAVRWARRKADLNGKDFGYVNVYEFSEIYDQFHVKTFSEDLDEWIDFVCDCRDGSTSYQDFDIIMGKVADDKVFRVVDLYHAGIWDKKRALEEVKTYPDYDQIAFITQAAINELLVFRTAEEV